jgi:DNA-binding IclR family transcriptional regulator
MSHHLTNQAWEIELRSNQKIVFLALAHLSQLSTQESAPSVRRLAFMCGLSDSGVRDQLAQLIEARLVERVETADGSGYRIYLRARP